MNNDTSSVTVVGAGLAGSEAAWQLAQRGLRVRLIEMKPVKMTPAHHSPDFAELCCSNSLRGDRLENAVGLLKEELRRMGSLILACADATRVEAGGCLAVDRGGFSALVTEKIRSHPNITVLEQELTAVPQGPVIIATGPLTSEPLSQAIAEYFGGAGYLNFYDAAAPLVTAESIDMDQAWFASRYDRGTPDYVNCAMDEDQYKAFVRELAAAQQAPVHGQAAARLYAGGVCTGEDQTSRPPKLLFQKANGIFQPVAPQGIGADQLGKVRAVVRGRHFDRLHLHEPYLQSALGKLPGGLGAGQTGADDCYNRLFTHSFFQIKR